MKKLFLPFLTLSLLIVLSACSSDDSNQSPVLALNFNTVNDAFEAKTTGSFSFKDGFITISEISYEAETETDSTSVEFELEGIVVIDFATGIPSPDIRPIAIPAGTYQEVEIEIELLDDNSGPSLVIRGDYTDPNATVHPVRFEFSSGETFEIEREGTIVFTEDQSAIAQITFDPSVWFLGVNDEIMATATKNSDGVIVISETQNTEIFEIVANGLELATELEIEN